MPIKSYSGVCRERIGDQNCEEFSGSINFEEVDEQHWEINPNSDLFLKFIAHHARHLQSEHKAFDIYSKKDGKKVGWVVVDRYGYVDGSIDNHWFRDEGEPEP